MKGSPLCIVVNCRNGSLCTGVTWELVRHVTQHRASLSPGFAWHYGCKILDWYGIHEGMADAITREKQIKGGSRRNKLALIEALNPSWRDLYRDLL